MLFHCVSLKMVSTTPQKYQNDLFFDMYMELPPHLLSLALSLLC